MVQSVLRSSVRYSSTVSKITRVPSKFNATSSASNVKPNYSKGTLYHHPSPSIAKISTPDAFLPSNDPRKGLNLSGKPSTSYANAPPLSTPTRRELNLTPAQVTEIQNLRMSEPDKWTRKALADKFNVSPFTISLVSDANGERKEEMAQRLDTIKKSWSEGRRRARLERQKRKVSWYRDE